jgi:AcrR family transcriptional regulator
VYDADVPRLWTDTVEQHRAEVQDAILDSVASLAQTQGLAGVTMSELAERSGIGRATLYKYFSNIDAVLVAWHRRQVQRHLAQLRAARDGASEEDQLRAVLFAYAVTLREHHGSDLAAELHREDHVRRATAHLHEFVSDLVVAAAERGAVRLDVPPGELTSYALAAVTAAAGLRTRASVVRLVDLIVASLSPPR